MNVRIDTDPTLTAHVLPPPDTSLLVVFTLLFIATMLTALFLFVLYRKPYKKSNSQQTRAQPLFEEHPAIARLRARLFSRVQSSAGSLTRENNSKT